MSAATKLAAMFAYLDELRNSGETNMFGAASYLMREFGLNRTEARTVLGQWMETFSQDQAINRAKQALEKTS